MERSKILLHCVFYFNSLIFNFIYDLTSTAPTPTPTPTPTLIEINKFKVS